MSYLVLARKWRPKGFSEIVGQEAVVRMLTNALQAERLHHAYLFTGTRGVGKTTIARLFAKALSCEQGISPTPCGHCHHCQAFEAGHYLDLLEIDAASRTKVEDTRELLDSIHYPPNTGRYKIYLIDEVHMLSGHSFNALLKTLEEPPPQVIFLLATTDPKRLPITVLSRCLQFHLRTVANLDIAKHLQTICTQEGITAEMSGLTLLANAAMGSLRDALSLLDQAIIYSPTGLTYADIQTFLGGIEPLKCWQILIDLSEQQATALLKQVTALREAAIDVETIFAELLTALHKLAIAQFIPDTQDEIPDIARSLITKFNPEQVQLYYQIVLMGKRDLPLIPNPYLALEMVLLRLLAFNPPVNQEPNHPLTSTTAKPILKDTGIPTTSHQQTIATPPPAELPPETAAPSIPQQSWNELLPELQLTGMVYALAANCSLLTISTDQITLALSSLHQPMLNKKLHDRLQAALSEYFKRTMTLNIEITDLNIDTPHKANIVRNQAQQEAKLSTLLQDPYLQQIAHTFNVPLEAHRIKIVE